MSLNDLKLASASNTTEIPVEDFVNSKWASAELLVCALIQLALVTIAYRIDRQKTAPIFSTSSWAIALGILCGCILSFVSESRALSAGLSPEVLFYGLLPPIILEAGFNTQGRGFFMNFASILLLTVIGTLIATFVTGFLLYWAGQYHIMTETSLTAAEAYLFGALISAIDPVATLVVFKKSHAPSLLFNLVFGESVLNDAVAIVLFSIFQDFVAQGNTEVTIATKIKLIMRLITIFVGSVALAAVISYGSAYLLKHSDVALRHHPTYEICIVLLSCYACYLAADVCKWSGLLAVFFSGVFIRHYHMYNISEASSFAFKHLLSTMAFLSENFIYFYLGVSLIAYHDLFVWDWKFVVASITACVASRAFNTFPLCTIANVCWRREKGRRIPFRYMLVIWFSGSRGAIAFALSLNAHGRKGHEDHIAVIQSTTLATVLFTTVIFGAATGPLLKVLGLGQAEETPAQARSLAESGTSESCELDPIWQQPLDDRIAPQVNEASEGEKALLRGRSVRNLWVDLDEAYLKPVFGGKLRKQYQKEETQQPFRLDDPVHVHSNKTTYMAI